MGFIGPGPPCYIKKYKTGRVYMDGCTNIDYIIKLPLNIAQCSPYNFYVSDNVRP